MEFEGVDVHQRCALDPEMSTPGRGAILPAERASLVGQGINNTPASDLEDVQPVGRGSRNAFEFGSDCNDNPGGDPWNRTGTGRTE